MLGDAKCAMDVEWYRTFWKAVTWRVTATVTTIIIAAIVLGDISSATKIGGIEIVVKIAVYYLHEKLWQQTDYGITRSKVTPAAEITPNVRFQFS